MAAWSTFCTHWTTRLSSVNWMRSLPSPSMTISNLSDFCTITRFHTSSANPNESKPGPRFAVVAGTLTTTRSTCKPGGRVYS
eukprot:scaffold250367_cov31-Tisochrysis_lutea.AAC.6